MSSSRNTVATHEMLHYRLCIILLQLIVWGFLAACIPGAWLFLARVRRIVPRPMNWKRLRILRSHTDSLLFERLQSARMNHARAWVRNTCVLVGVANCLWLAAHPHLLFQISQRNGHDWIAQPRSINPHVECSAYGEDACCKMKHGDKQTFYGDDCLLARFNNFTLCTAFSIAKPSNFSVITCKGKRKPWEPPAVHEIYHSNFVATALSFMGCVLLEMRPSMLTHFKLDCLYCLVMLRLTMQAYFEPEAIVAAANNGPLLLFMAMVFLNARLSILMNTIYSIVVLTTIVRGQFKENVAVHIAVFHEVASLAAVVAMSILLHCKSVAEELAHIQVLESINTEEVAHSLLAAMGDAVLHLGPNLHVLKASETFSALLFRTYHLLEGKCFFRVRCTRGH